MPPVLWAAAPSLEFSLLCSYGRECDPYLTLSIPASLNQAVLDGLLKPFKEWKPTVVPRRVADELVFGVHQFSAGWDDGDGTNDMKRSSSSHPSSHSHAQALSLLFPWVPALPLASDWAPRELLLGQQVVRR
ncbi:hypothetical protein P7K49_018917 [Saguinus oedipus]|uniref:Uncharacterized protein n=1 Tax=Saguinus oedipus TaxID=9490 RepID=A0ABQ9UW28_SAGOE|nr:hypothetical protein P7K49_018917 [Saguinus oedipus]